MGQYTDSMQKRDETIPRIREQELSQHHVIESSGFFLPKYSGRHEFALEASTDASLQFGVSNRCLASPRAAVTRALAIRSSRENRYSVLLQAGLYYPMKIVFVFPARDAEVPVHMGFMFKEPHGEFREDIADYVYQAEFGPTGLDKPEKTLIESALMPGCRALNQGASGFEVNYRTAQIFDYEELDDEFFIEGVSELEIVGSKLPEKKVNINFEPKPQELGMLKEQETETEDTEAPLWYFKSMPAHHLKLHYDNEEEAQKPTYRPMKDNSQPNEGLLLGFEDPHLVYGIVDEDMNEPPIEVSNSLHRESLEIEEGDPKLSYESFYADFADEMLQSDQPFGYHDDEDDGSILDFNGENSVDWDVKPDEFEFDNWNITTTHYDEFPAPDELQLPPITADQGELRGDQPPDEGIPDGYHDENSPPLPYLESLNLTQAAYSRKPLQNDAVDEKPLLEMESLELGNEKSSLSSPSVAKFEKHVISQQPSTSNGAESGIELQATQMEAKDEDKSVLTKEVQDNLPSFMGINISPQDDEHSTLQQDPSKTEPSDGQNDPPQKEKGPLLKKASAWKSTVGAKSNVTMNATSVNEIVRLHPYHQNQRKSSHFMESHPIETIAVVHDNDEKVKIYRVRRNATSNMKYSALSSIQEKLNTTLRDLENVDIQNSEMGPTSQKFRSVHQGSVWNKFSLLSSPKLVTKPETARLDEDANENHHRWYDSPTSFRTSSKVLFDLKLKLDTLHKVKGISGENLSEDSTKTENPSPKSFECETDGCSSLYLLQSNLKTLESDDIIHSQALASLESQVDPQETLGTTELSMSHDGTRNNENSLFDSFDTTMPLVPDFSYDSLGSFVKLNPDFLVVGLCLICLF